MVSPANLISLFGILSNPSALFKLILPIIWLKSVLVIVLSLNSDRQG